MSTEIWKAIHALQKDSHPSIPHVTPEMFNRFIVELRTEVVYLRKRIEVLEQEKKKC